MIPAYTGTATATGGREGRVASSDGTFDLAVTVPRALGGAGDPGTNPEQLFAAAYAACFASAVGKVARVQKLAVGEITVTARATIGPDPVAGSCLSVELVVSVPGVDRTQAEALVATANQVCPYSRATRGNVAVTLRVAS